MPSQVANAGFDDSFSGRANIWALAADLAVDNPWFGYGPSAWDLEFRRAAQMPFAFSAHNQFYQSLSVGGRLGGLTLAIYAITLAWFAWRTVRAGRGLGLVLVLILLIRGISTALESTIVMTADAFQHLLVLSLLMGWAGVGAAIGPRGFAPAAR
ncbi:MAG: O-antigen ligase family protein [Burkholderiaceae bacterium]